VTLLAYDSFAVLMHTSACFAGLLLGNGLARASALVPKPERCTAMLLWLSDAPLPFPSSSLPSLAVQLLAQGGDFQDHKILPLHIKGAARKVAMA
jgi:hypothetical protein